MRAAEEFAAIRAGRCPGCNTSFSELQIRKLAGSPGENVTCACGATVGWIAYRIARDGRPIGKPVGWQDARSVEQ